MVFRRSMCLSLRTPEWDPREQVSHVALFSALKCALSNSWCIFKCFRSFLVYLRMFQVVHPQNPSNNTENTLTHTKKGHMAHLLSDPNARTHAAATRSAEDTAAHAASRWSPRRRPASTANPGGVAEPDGRRNEES